MAVRVLKAERTRSRQRLAGRDQAYVARRNPEFLGALSDGFESGCIARGAAAMPNIARVARGRLTEDIRRAAATGRLHDIAPDLAFEFVLGITVGMMQSAAEGRLSSTRRNKVSQFL